MCSGWHSGPQDQLWSAGLPLRIWDILFPNSLLGPTGGLGHLEQTPLRQGSRKRPPEGLNLPVDAQQNHRGQPGPLPFGKKATPRMDQD